jgi:hypothetical protein
MEINVLGVVIRLAHNVWLSPTSRVVFVEALGSQPGYKHGYWLMAWLPSGYLGMIEPVNAT